MLVMSDFRLTHFYEKTLQKKETYSILFKFNATFEPIFRVGYFFIVKLIDSICHPG